MVLTLDFVKDYWNFRLGKRSRENKKWCQQ